MDPDLLSEGADGMRAERAGAEGLFHHGLCLPSGTAMTDSDLDRIIDTMRSCRR